MMESSSFMMNFEVFCFNPSYSAIFHLFFWYETRFS
ncbi:CLUMA_CG008738, isoform A [Clunio marinus]|uniref:CLUMA_CG008738, isoform A n=1 Tax=Clunio marinus TaxID=568069 RepID=A0A1J1I4I1_9DIPT|nr:CLUMA_CG008738, isoform A [Clunio marinus]